MLDLIRSMMGFPSLLISFWGYALEIAYFVLNNILSKSISKTPYEIWSGRRLNLTYLKVWEYLTYVKSLQIDKLGSRSNKCYYVGYPKKIKKYCFYLAEEQELLGILFRKRVP